MAKKKTNKEAAAKKDGPCTLTVECCDAIADSCHNTKKTTECPTLRALAKKLQLAAQAVSNHMRSVHTDSDDE
jgi:hypothetical protein